MRNLTKTMNALSDETRLRILRVLLEKECCVCEIMQALDISQSRASRNLGILREAGLLRARRDGAWIVYSVDKEGMQEYLSDMVKAIRKALEGNQVVALDLERLKTAVRVGPSRVNH
ncbi:MAG TPA: winged helix-turn-helix transcriptional regulator [Dehalococcoidia bacterium]|nr:winged helix-turn-helix transcriptional regulator [Dehalococcoidia bacterium]